MKVSIDVKGLDEIENKLKYISNKAHDTAPLMAELAHHLYDVAFNSLRDETSPDGISWNPLKASTKKAKKKHKDSILYENGDLRDTLTFESSKDSAQIGLNATKGGYPYPVVHQFGSSDGKIVARPFMPIHNDGTLYSDTKDELQEIVEDYMKEESLLK